MSGNAERIRPFSFVNQVWKETMLREHMEHDYYSPTKDYVISNYVRLFSKYWKRELTYDELVSSLPIGESEVQMRFSSFLNIEDLRE